MAPWSEPPERRDLADVLVARRREHDAHVVLVESLGRAGEDRREVRGVDERNEHADEAGAAVRRRDGPVRGVALLPDDLPDERPCLLGDVVTFVHDAGDGRQRDAGEVGDPAGGDAPSVHGDLDSITFRKFPE